MTILLLLIGMYLWAGFSVWILGIDEDPSTRTPKWLAITLVIWWLVPIVALFEVN